MKTVFRYQRMDEHSCIRLICEKDKKEWLGVDLYPESGFKSAGLCYRGTWLQPYHPKWSRLLKNDMFGNSILFPTPNRVRNHTFSFQGQKVEMVKNEVPRTQHGIAMDSRWELLRLESRKDCALAEAEFCIRKGDENYRAFPWECSLRVVYCLTEDTFSFTYRVKNLSRRPMPFGIGLHPWFLLPEKPQEVSLRMSAEYCFETTEDLLPTKRLLDVRGNEKLDLNRFRSVRELDLDTVFLTEGRDVCLRYRDLGYQIRIHATKEFFAGVVFTAFSRGMVRKGYEAFCVETQSCCTDAINLYEEGFEKSGLLILSPGEEKAGEIQYLLESKKECGKKEDGEKNKAVKGGKDEI